MASLMRTFNNVHPIRQAVRAIDSRFCVYSMIKCMSGGKAGDGVGRGGGTGGSIRDAGGAFGKMQAANEEQFFRNQQAKQLAALKKDIDMEMNHHEKSIKHLEESIAFHKKRLAVLQAAKAPGDH